MKTSNCTGNYTGTYSNNSRNIYICLVITIGYYHVDSPFQLVFLVKFQAGFPVRIYSRLDTYNQGMYSRKNLTVLS